jgi:hypothetical protein
MSTLSQALGLDHPSNKGLLDLLNGVGRAIAVKSGLSGIDPAKLLLGLLLNKYAPQHTSLVMDTIGGIAVSDASAVLEKAEGTLPPIVEDPIPVPIPVPDAPVPPLVTPVATVPALEQASENVVLPAVETSSENIITKLPLFSR